MGVRTIMQKIVPLSVVATTAAHQCVVPKYINNTIAHRAIVLGVEDWHAQAPLQHWRQNSAGTLQSPSLAGNAWSHGLASGAETRLRCAWQDKMPWQRL